MIKMTEPNNIISIIGNIMISNSFSWSDNFFMFVWISLINLATARAAPTFMNSLGCIVKLLNEYHDNDPLILFPKMNNPKTKI